MMLDVVHLCAERTGFDAESIGECRSCVANLGAFCSRASD